METDDKAAFLREIPAIREQAFKARTIRSSFRKQGLYPFNPKEILGPLRKAKSPTPKLQIFTTPPPPSSSISPPSTIHRLRQSIGKAQVYINSTPELDQSFTQRLNRIFQSTIETQELISQLYDDLRLRTQYQQPQFTKKSLKKLRENGPLDIEDANRHIQYRSKEKRRQDLRRLKREQALRHNISPIQADKEILIEPDSRQDGKDDNQCFFI
jgi:hypothetical protein